MGGFGSTRWMFHYKKTLVEDCYKMTIYSLKHYLKPGYIGNMIWSRGDHETGNITYRVIGSSVPTAFQLTYKLTDHRTGENMDFIYSVYLQTTLTAWGSLRYWFTCPLTVNGWPCKRRVGALYLPPGRQYFGCRHCYRLTYESSQKEHEYESLYLQLAAAMQDESPGLKAADIRYLLSGGKGKPPKGYYQRLRARHLGELEDLFTVPNQYADYLTAAELCAQSGLDAGDLAQLEGARLLLPDHDGKYRPKLVGWARKLAYLLSQGWEIDQIKCWSKGRWSSPDPRQWPPKKAL